MMLDVLIAALIASTDALYLKLKCMFEEAQDFWLYYESVNLCCYVTNML